MTRPYRSLSTVAESPHEDAAQAEFTFILAAILCALVCIVGLIAVAYCTWLQRRSLANRVPAQPSVANKGIEKKLIEAIPKFTYKLAKEDKGEDCVICLVEYADGDEVRVLPQCEHRFHIECIDKWLDSHSSCPSCRQIVVIDKRESLIAFPINIDGKAAFVESKRHNGGSSSNNKLVQGS